MATFVDSKCHIHRIERRNRFLLTRMLTVGDIGDAIRLIILALFFTSNFIYGDNGERRKSDLY